MRKQVGEAGLISDDNRSILTLEERGREYRLRNDSRLRILCYKIDGSTITQGPRCDFGIGVEALFRFYLIELKGKNLRKAARQIMATMEALSPQLKGYIVYARIILSRIQRPDLRASDVILLERKLAKLKGNLIRACSKFEDAI